MGCWTHHNMWLLFIAGLQVGLLTALAPDSTCNPSTEFSCRNDTSMCIPLSRVKDGTPDCPDKSDEECNEDEFQCQSIHQCIPMERYHDGWPDCDDGSDEECGRGQFRCRCGIPHCIEGSKVKDGTKDCEDGSDEVSGKSRNKTARCPDENRLQDLLALEKKRKKRQIHTSGASFNKEDDDWTLDETLLNLQPSVTESYSNNFQYSYTKFLNERLSRDRHNPHINDDLNEEYFKNIHIFDPHNNQKSVSPKPFMVKTETDSYGSLNSGKIYQTAVNELISVMPSAEYTILKFDKAPNDKKYFMKSKKEKNQKINEYEPRRFSDLIMKIAAIFQNESESEPALREEINDNRYLKDKLPKIVNKRKLLSVTDEEQETSEKDIHKRILLKSDITHTPLEHSPTVPYMPQSDIHTTGIVMSTTGTDVIDGRTTEWTTVIEGTFISGTYAHIVHSTSKIYYTVNTPTPSMTLDVKTASEDDKNLNSKKNKIMNMDAKSSEIHRTTIAHKIKETKVEKSSRSQRRNDKSLRDDDLISVLSSPNFSSYFDFKPTASFSSLLDIVTAYDGSKTDVDASTSSLYTTIESSLEKVKDFIFSDPVEEKLNLKSVEMSEKLPPEMSTEVAVSVKSFSNDGMVPVSEKLPPVISTKDEISVKLFSNDGVVSEIISPDNMKNIDLSEERLFITDNKQSDMNVIGRMVGDLNSTVKANAIDSFILNNNSNVLASLTDLEFESILPTSTMSQDSGESKITVSEIETDEIKKIKLTDEFETEFSKSKTLSSSSLLIKDTSLSSSFNNPQSGILTRMETSLRIPDVTDLFVAFIPASNENNITDVVSGTDESRNSMTLESEKVVPSSTHSVLSTAETVQESSKSFSNLEILLSDISTTRIISEPTPSAANMQTDRSDVAILDNVTMFSSFQESSTSISMEKSSKLLHTTSTEAKILSRSDNAEIVASDLSSVHSSPVKESEVMVFLGIASTVNVEEISPSKTLSDSSLKSEGEISKSEKLEATDSTSPQVTDFHTETLNVMDKDTLKDELNKDSTMTVLLLPSMNLDDLKNLMDPTLSISMLKSSSELTMSDSFIETQSVTTTPDLTDFHLTEKSIIEDSKKDDFNEKTASDTIMSETEEPNSRSKRAISESVTILRPEGRIVSTDARVYLTPTTLYTTYTYFTTILIPGGGTTVRSSLHIDSIVVEPTDRAVYGHDEHAQPCTECRIRATAVHTDYETGYIGRPLTPDHFHIETVPYDVGRASEITHRTTYTYYTTRFRGGTPFVETRKETRTDVTPIPSVRYSPFEIGTYYDGDIDDYHYHTQPPRVEISRPHDITHRTTFTYYTTRIRNGITTVETRKETDTNITPIPTYYRPGHLVTQPVRTIQPSYSQRIDPSLYKPDRVTHRTTYTYHTTRFRDGVPIVNTRKETETNVTPIPTYTRPGYTQRHTAHRVVPSRPLTYHHDVIETYNPYVRQGTNPYVTHRTTYTYFTTRLIGGSAHVDTNYVTETNITPVSTVPYIRGTTYSHPHRDDGYYDTECPVCRQAERATVSRQAPHTIVRGRNPDRASRRSEVLNPEIKPSTATLFSTYTYATTQLTRGGRPVVRTREHTVTEILSDVVLPTLKFGDRIRSKRTVKPEEMIPKYTKHIDTVHVVPVRHTFSRTNSYADGRQGRRIAINNQRHNTLNRNNAAQNNRTPNLRKIDVTNKENEASYRHRSQNSYKNNGINIQPTSVTYFSTYTYFTTELQDGKPVVKTREHTVTEILTDVIVPTVSSVRRPHGLRATRTHGDIHHRPVRDVQNQNLENILSLRKLLSTSNNEDNTPSKNEKEVHLQPSVLSNSDTHINTQNPTFLLNSKDMNPSSAITPPLLNTHFEIPDNRMTPSLLLENSSEFKITESYDDLTAAGAEERRVVIATPVTHYTTYTYYATKIKPGGSRIIETSTKVSSSVIYPHSTNAYDKTEYTRLPYNKRKLYLQNSHPQSSLETQARRQYQSDVIQGVGSQAVRRFDRPYRRQNIEEYQRTCYSCGGRQREQQNPYNIYESTNRITRVQKNEYLTRIPARNRNNVARRIFDRPQNNVYDADSNIKPTHVTYYSTYTYFTTEPVDGSSVVRSREHTVTEILTNVIVPTVASLNRAYATEYDKHHYRSKRENSKDNLETPVSAEDKNSLIKRKLLSLQEENTTLVPDLLEENSPGNFTVEGLHQNENTSSIEGKVPEVILFDVENNKKNLSLFQEKNLTLFRSVSINTTELNSSSNKSEISFNGASRIFEETDKHFESVSEPFLYTTSSEFIDKIRGTFTDSHFNVSLSNSPYEMFLDVFPENKENFTYIKHLDDKNNFKISLNPITSDEEATSTERVSISPNEDHKLESIKIIASELKTENKIIASKTLEINPISIASNLDVLKSSILDNKSFLGITEPSFPLLFTENPIISSATPVIDKTKFTNNYPLPSRFTFSDSDKSELSFRSEDLEAEGAELRRIVVATPTTHYTTYTYYSTILKPGGKSEIVTNTKIAASTYYPDSPNYHGYNDDSLRYVRRPVSNQVSKPVSLGSYSTKIHDLQRANAVARNQYAYPSLREFKPHRPSFTRVKPSQYQTVINHNSNHNRCLSCNKEYVNENNNFRHNRPINHHGKSYLTSLPVRRLTDQYVRPSRTVPYTVNPPYTGRIEAARRIHTDYQNNFNVNKIPYEVPEIKPTHVTYYSTYTYFTTELQNGSPVVRSREHTVTEILTDVVVPTVTSLSRAKATKYPSLRGRRDVFNEEENFDTPSNFLVQRKLLSIDDDADIFVSESFKFPVSSQIENPVIDEDTSLSNRLASSFSSSTLTNTVSDPIEIDDNFLSNDKFSKAFAAYLSFLESSGAAPQNLTMTDHNDVQSGSHATKTISPLMDSQEIKSDSSKNKPESESKRMTTTLTSEMKKNGRMTKFTTTIYGTYINGVYAQRAQSTSDIIPITEMNLPKPETTLMFKPSRQPGLVRSIVSRRVRGPVAVHLTTEIYGTYVGGAYAQTARVFTSSQPLSSTRESSRHKMSTYSTTIPTGTRKTGLLSTRVLRSKVDGSTTLLFVSEIYGTHIGGAYAHLGTYTTRTIVQTPATTSVNSEPTSTLLPTYYMEDLTTGLVTASVNEKSSNGITTRYHYQVYGTYLDGTYAHVPSISTETLTPRSIGTISPTLLMKTSLETTKLTDDIKTVEPTQSFSSTQTETIQSKLGLIRASTRVNVSNGTTTQHIFEVYGTYLDGNYAHVPSVSVITIRPSDSTQYFQPTEKTTVLKINALETIKKDIEKPTESNNSTVKQTFNTKNSEIFEILDEIKNSEVILHSQSVLLTKTETFITKPDLPYADEFEILTIFSDTNTEEKINTVSPYDDITIFPDELDPKNTVILNEKSDQGYEIINDGVVLEKKSSPLIMSSKVSDSMHTISDEHKQQTSSVLPILLPEALRLSLSHDKANYRIRRNDPFSPYLRSSFTESIKSQKETQRSSLIATTPLPSSIYSELSSEFIENTTKIHLSSNMLKRTFQTKSNGRFPKKFKSKSVTSKSVMNSKAKLFYLKRSKRAAIRSTFGSSKRFGASSTSNRKFSASSTFKRVPSSSSTRGFKSSSNKILITPTKAVSMTQSKSVPNFLARSQRSKPILTSKISTSVIKPTSSSSKYSLPSIRPRRFGKKENENLSKMEEDFEASETVPQSVTEDKIKPTPTSSSRFHRPSKFSKFLNRPVSSSAASRSNKIVLPTSSRRSRPQPKSRSSRNRVKDYRDYDTEIQPTSLVESTSSKKRFTLTTTFDISLKPTASYLTNLDMDEGNNLQEEKSNNKRRNKSRDYNDRNRRGGSYKPVFDSDDNEVRPDKPKSLPLPVFGRSRGLKRPPKFDPRTIKLTTPSSTSTIIYLTPSLNETKDNGLDSEEGGPITVTNVFTTVKTLPVHLGPRTSFATITTTAFTTSTVQPEDLTYLTFGDITKTLLSAITGFPDVNMPLDKQFTVVTEIILTTTEIESTSLVAIKIGFGTRTDTVVRKHKMTTLTTQTNTIVEEKKTSSPFQQEYPYFPNPFAPPIPSQNKAFSLSLAENSFVSTQTVTSTTVLPLFFNGKTVLTTLTSTSLTEETLVKTTTFKVPQQPTMQPFIFPQPVFILPSVTTAITVKFTAQNGEVYSIVTEITVPLALNGHTRIARSAAESVINPTASYSDIFHEKTDSYLTHTPNSKIEDSTEGIILQSSFSANVKGPLSNEFTERLSKTLVGNRENTHFFTSTLENSKTKYNGGAQTKKHKLSNPDSKKYTFSEIKNDSYKMRKLLQFEDEEIESLREEDISTKDVSKASSAQGSIPNTESYFTYIPDTFHLIGPGYDEEGLSRPIPSVRVVPTRRAYVRRLKPSGSQNMPFDNSDEEFDLRRNNQNYPANANVPRGTELIPVRTGIYRDDNIGFRRNVPMVNRPLVYQEGPVGTFGNLRNVQYFSPNRPNQPIDFEGDVFSPPAIQPNFALNRPNRPQDIPSNIGRNPGTFPLIRNNRPPQSEGYDALRNLPSYSPVRQNVPRIPPREEPSANSNRYEEEGTRNQINRPQTTVTTPPRRVIRLRRPVNSQQVRPQNEEELLNRKPIVNVLSDEKESKVRARGPVILTNSAIIRDSDDPKTNENETPDDENDSKYTNPLPLTYYTTFTYMTTFLNGPSTAYSTREAVVSNIATETVNPRLVGLIRSRGGFTPPNGAQTAVPLGSRAQGATTTIVNLASRIQLYNSDVYHGRYSDLIGDSLKEKEVTPTAENLRTIPITEVASLPKTYYTLFTYFYTLSDGDKSVHSQRSETISNIDTQTEPFVLQDFASTVDSSGFLTLKPDKQTVNLGLRTAGGTTTEVNLELKTVVHFEGLKNAVIERGSITPTLVEVFPSDTNTVFNNYLDPDDAEVQDQQTYPQTVPIQPSFSSANEIYVGTRRSSASKEATPEIPSNSRIVRTQSVRGPVRVASTVLQRPGTLRSGVFAPRPGVRVRVRPVSSRVVPIESSSLLSSEPDLSSYSISFDPSRTISEEVTDFEDDETDVTEEDDSTEEYATEETTSAEEKDNKRQPLPGRKRLKITIRRSPGVSASKTSSAFIRPTRTRPRFYVVTRTASPTGGIRPPKRPVSVKVSRRLRPSSEPEYETYTTMTSVPVVFGLSTTYRNALVTSSSLVTSDASVEPSKTVVLTYFTTTTYTVPYTVDGVATYTTLEETNSRVATETLDPDDDLSFVTSTVLEYSDEISASSADLMKHPPQTLKPQLINNQLSVGSRVNLATKVSNGVTLIVASDGENEATEILTQPTVTLRPTVVTDALYMTNKDITTLYEPRTFYTTFTYFTTFFSGGQPSISTSEQVITNIYSVPVTHSITRTQPATEPLTLIETSENLVSKTIYSTHTFYATLFNGTSTIVTPIEELQSSVISATETYTITKTIMPEMAGEIKATETLNPLTTTTSVYRTRTNFVTLFRGTESIVSPLEEIETDIVTLTLDNRIEPSKLPPKELYTTRTIQATNTHYITLFSGTESILSSITEVAPSVITELVKQLQEPTTTPFRMSSIQPSSVLSSSPSSSVEPIFQDLVPSIRTQYTTLTYFTTLFTDSSTILSSREEVATSYITLFVPAPAPGATNTEASYTSKTDLLTHGMSSKPSEIEESSVTPTTEILTFYTTYTYYTTLFRGTETIISDSETVVTQYVTIESTPTDSASRYSTSFPPANSRPNYSASFEIKTMTSPTPTVSSPTYENDFSSITSDKEASNAEVKILGVSTNIESNSEAPSILTGIPSTDANGATHILFTDFIVPSSVQDSETISTALFSEYVTPSLPELASSKFMVTKPSSYTFDETTFFPHETSTPSSARDSSDLATTRLTDNNVATHHMVLHPTTTYQSGSSQTMGLKPGAVIDLSDVLTNTNLVGNLGETIKDIVNLFAANGNRAGKNSTSKSSHSSSDSTVILPSGGVTVSSAEDPVFIPIGAIARSTKSDSRPAEANTEVPLLRPSTMLSGFTPIVSGEDKNTFDANNRKIDAVSSIDLASGTLTSIVFGSNTIFIQPSGTVQEIPATMLFSDMDGRFHNSFNDNVLRGSVSNEESNQQATPGIKPGDSTSLITGLETIFFGIPDARQPPQATTQIIQGSGSTSSIVGYETIFFDSPKDFYVPGSNQVNITGATTIFGTFPILTDAGPSSDSTPQSTFTSSSSGETTIFFPVPGDNQHQSPGTRYVTSVESVTLTLTLTTSSVYQTEDTPVTVTSVFTTTIPPRTFVSTIIGDRTILGTQPEPTEALQVIPTIQPSESTTTVTTTTLIFNSIATTVVRTLVIPTNAIQPTKPSTTEATDMVKLGGIGITPKDRPRVTTDRTTPRKPIQLFKSGTRPTDSTTPKPLRTGPPLKLFPTKPPTTTTLKPPTRPVTTRKTSFRKPGKTLVPMTDGCLRECNLKNKEVCKQNPDKSWSCQCRPGFFRKNGTEECRDVKSFVVLVRVLKMGENDVTYSPDFSNHLSPEYKNLTTTARKAVDDAYKTSSVGDDFVSTNVISVTRDRNVRPEGVLVNLTVQLTGEKPANEEILKEELTNSLEAASSDVSLSNASVSPIYQRVEDVQDFDECYDDSYNDCSKSAICINLPGTYTCQCKEGYQDLETLLPGRICSGEIKDCDYCNNRGVCIMTEDDNKFCRCYRMYLGKQCEINGLVLAIALPIALALLILTMFCLLCGCRKLRQRRAQKPKPNVFKGMVPPMAGTLDRKAMIMDSSSESSGEHRPPAHQHHAYDGFSDDVANSTMKRSRRSESLDDHISPEFQMPTVLIPRAKHSHPKQVNAPYPNYRMPPHGDMDRW